MDTSTQSIAKSLSRSNKYIGTPLGLYVLTLLGGSISVVLWKIWGWLRDQIMQRLYASVRIGGSEAMYTNIFNYLSRMGYFEKTSHLTAKQITGGPGRRSRMGHTDMHYNDVDVMVKQIQYSPSNAPIEFWWSNGKTRGHWFRVKLNGFDARPDECTRDYSDVHMTIEVYASSRRPIEELIYEAHQQSVASAGEYCMIQRWQGSSDELWLSQTKYSPHREMDSVVLPTILKQSILEDIEEFKNHKDWYAGRGMPYKRGYLFSGPPGCGKTSTIRALASKLNYTIIIVDLNNKKLTNNSTISSALNPGPRYIIVLEEIDRCFKVKSKSTKHHLKKDSEKDSDTSDSDDSVNNHDEQDTVESVEDPCIMQNKSLSFDVLLQALDCTDNHETIVIMTTNHPERLDPALIRPGRIDKRFEFTLANKQQIKELYFNFYNTVENNGLDIAGMSDVFASKLEVNKYSPAEIQGKLLDNKKNPQHVLDNVKELF